MDFNLISFVSEKIQLKNVVIVVGSSVIGGAEKQSLLLAKQLRLNYHVEMVFLGQPGPFIEVARESGIKVWNSQGTIFSDLITIFLCLYKSKPICQVNFLYRADILGGFVGKILQVRTIINSARNTCWPNFNLGKKILLQIVSITVPKYVVANSQAAKTWHLDIGYPESKVIIIPNFLQPAVLRGGSQENSRFRFPLRLGIASRAVIGKGHKALIEAVKILETRGVRCEVWFKGYGVPAWNFVSDECKKNGVECNIQEGELDLSQWFRDIDIYCGISEEWESDSNSVNEAVMYEVPIIISELIPVSNYLPAPPQVKAGMPALIADGILGLLHTPLSQLEEVLQVRRRNLTENRDTARIAELWFTLIQEIK